MTDFNRNYGKPWSLADKKKLVKYYTPGGSIIPLLKELGRHYVSYESLQKAYRKFKKELEETKASEMNWLEERGLSKEDFKRTNKGYNCTSPKHFGGGVNAPWEGTKNVKSISPGGTMWPALCDECYKEWFGDDLKPITEWSDDLIGKRVRILNNNELGPESKKEKKATIVGYDPPAGPDSEDSVVLKMDTGIRQSIRLSRVELVEETKLKPITEWSDDLIGKTATTLTKIHDAPKGSKCIIRGNWLNNSFGKPGIDIEWLNPNHLQSSGEYYCEFNGNYRFALAPDQPSELKIYKKDDCWWAEKDGYTVCAKIEYNDNKLVTGTGAWVAIKDPDGCIIMNSDKIIEILETLELPDVGLAFGYYYKKLEALSTEIEETKEDDSTDDSMVGQWVECTRASFFGGITKGEKYKVVGSKDDICSAQFQIENDNGDCSWYRTSLFVKCDAPDELDDIEVGSKWIVKPEFKSGFDYCSIPEGPIEITGIDRTERFPIRITECDGTTNGLMFDIFSSCFKPYVEKQPIKNASGLVGNWVECIESYDDVSVGKKYKVLKIEYYDTMDDDILIIDDVGDKEYYDCGSFTTCEQPEEQDRVSQLEEENRALRDQIKKIKDLLDD